MIILWGILSNFLLKIFYQGVFECNVQQKKYVRHILQLCSSIRKYKLNVLQSCFVTKAFYLVLLFPRSFDFDYREKQG